MKSFKDFSQINEMRVISKMIHVTVYKDGRDKKGTDQNVLFKFMDKVEHKHSGVFSVVLNGQEYYPSDKRGKTFLTNKESNMYRTDDDARIYVTDDFEEIWID